MGGEASPLNHKQCDLEGGGGVGSAKHISLAELQREMIWQEGSHPPSAPSRPLHHWVFCGVGLVHALETLAWLGRSCLGRGGGGYHRLHVWGSWLLWTWKDCIRNERRLSKHNPASLGSPWTQAEFCWPRAPACSWRTSRFYTALTSETNR